MVKGSLPTLYSNMTVPDKEDPQEVNWIQKDTVLKVDRYFDIIYDSNIRLLLYLISFKSKILVINSCEVPSLGKCKAEPATTGPHGGTLTAPPITESHTTRL